MRAGSLLNILCADSQSLTVEGSLDVFHAASLEVINLEVVLAFDVHYAHDMNLLNNACMQNNAAWHQLKAHENAVQQLSLLTC